MTDDSEQEPIEASGFPGCGLGIYAALLVFICMLGLGGIGIATYGLFQDASVTAAEIQPGHELQVYQLSALRRSGLVEVNEVPAVFHDESRTLDGAIVCVLMQDRLIRVESESAERGWGCSGVEERPVQGWQLAYDQIQSIESTGDHFTEFEFIATGLDAQQEPLEIRCSFGKEEGGLRMKRQLQQEAGLEEDY
jgi:hypothetical protein